MATAQELQNVISNLQNEQKSSQAKLAKQAEREQRTAAAVSDAHAAAAKVKVRHHCGGTQPHNKAIALKSNYLLKVRKHGDAFFD